MTTPLLAVEGLRKAFPGRAGSGSVVAVDDVSFQIADGEVVGLVGESGSGKTTVGRMILRLIDPDGGAIRLKGEDITAIEGKALRAVRRRMQIVFQDPFASLNRRMRVRAILEEPLRIHFPDLPDRAARVAELLGQVGLSSAAADRFPHEFSGGQRQRIGIARALAVSPSLIVADEPVSALDVSVQAQVLNLLSDLKEEMGLAMLFIAHDLSVVRHVSDRVMVMYLGRIVESAPVDRLFDHPVHPYTEALLSAIPSVEPDARRERILLSGDVPSPVDVPSGCVFRTRCPIAEPACADSRPPLEEVAPGHLKACFRR